MTSVWCASCQLTLSWMVKINTSPFYWDTGTLHGTKHSHDTTTNSSQQTQHSNRYIIVKVLVFFPDLVHTIKLSNLSAVNITAVNLTATTLFPVKTPQVLCSTVPALAARGIVLRNHRREEPKNKNKVKAWIMRLLRQKLLLVSEFLVFLFILCKHEVQENMNSFSYSTHGFSLNTLTVWTNGVIPSLAEAKPLSMAPGLSGTSWAGADSGGGG